MGVVGLEWVVVMGRDTKKVENHWFSATVSNEQQRQEQSVRPVRRATHVREIRFTFVNEVSILLISFIA